ncbi:Arv1-like family-domain-containing protein [Amylostereum chailletii]|nr:Arv1-like family-domain-containing protein [Amylostereum chailletii]
MPLCIHCTQPVPYLYTIYQSARNVRLEQCPSCHAFADPYVEHDRLIVLLDLILLKRGVYRHLLFNRGSPPRRVGAKKSEEESKRDEGLPEGRKDDAGRETDKARWVLTLRVGAAIVLVDGFIRWSELRSRVAAQGGHAWSQDAPEAFARVLLGCLVETFAFHVGITFSSVFVLTVLGWLSTRKNMSFKSTPSNIRQSLKYSHIPLCLFYSSFTKFFLLLLLSIWDPPRTSTLRTSSHAYTHTIAFQHPILRSAWQALDDDKLDRQWVVRNVLGGMAAGFGLRVVLDCHPFFTTLVILAGWAVKTAVATVVSGWVGEDAIIGEAWLAYSIP